MLQSVRRAHRACPDHPELHACIVRLRLLMDEWADKLDSRVSLVLQQQLESLFKGRDAQQINQEFLDAHPNSLEHIYQGLYNIYLLYYAYYILTFS